MMGVKCVRKIVSFSEKKTNIPVGVLPVVISRDTVNGLVGARKPYLVPTCKKEDPGRAISLFPASVSRCCISISESPARRAKRIRVKSVAGAK